MQLSELLHKFRFVTEENCEELWRFVDFSTNYDRPLKMKSLSENATAFFNFNEIYVGEAEYQIVEMQELREKINAIQRQNDKIEKQRLEEWQKLNNQLKQTSNEINTIIDDFEEMSIDLIKKKLKRISNQCVKTSY